MDNTGMWDPDDEDWMADQLVRLLAWGTAALLAIVSLVTSGVRFDLYGAPDERLRAALLIGMTCVSFGCWAAFTYWVRVYRLGRACTSPRVLPVRLLCAYIGLCWAAATVLSVCAAIPLR